MREVWKQYKDTNYEVCRSGKVRNISTHKEVGVIDKNGRCIIRMGRKGSTVHRSNMVAETFLGDITGMDVHHNNMKRDDDRLSNLSILTPLQHKRLHNNKNITVQLDDSWNVVKVYDSSEDAEHALGKVKNGHIQNAIRKGRKTMGYRWIILRDLPENLIFVDENVSEERERALNEVLQLIDNQRCLMECLDGVESPPISTIRKKVPLEALKDLHFS